LSVLSIGVQGLGSAATYLGSLLIMMKVSKGSTLSTGSTMSTKRGYIDYSVHGVQDVRWKRAEQGKQAEQEKKGKQAIQTDILTNRLQIDTLYVDTCLGTQL